MSQLFKSIQPQSHARSWCGVACQAQRRHVRFSNDL